MRQWDLIDKLKILLRDAYTGEPTQGNEDEDENEDENDF